MTPVARLGCYGEVDGAVRIANDTDYGLGSSAWTTDAERGKDVAPSFRDTEEVSRCRDGEQFDCPLD